MNMMLDPVPLPVPPPPEMAEVEVRLWPDLRLSVLRLVGEVRPPQVLARLAEALADTPGAAGWDCICDVRRHTGQLGVEGMNAVVALRFANPAHRAPSREVLLTHDPGMVFIARYLDHIAPHVAHSVSADPVEACRRATGGRMVPEVLGFLAGL